MPINLIDIQKKLSAFSEQAREVFQRVNGHLSTLEETLNAYAAELDLVKQIVAQANEVDPRLRCAMPVDEPLNAAIPVGEMPARVTLLAVDGSQINPSRHTRVPFCVINIGGVEMERGSGLTPRIHQETQLLDYVETVSASAGILTEGAVALKRDLREREFLAEWAEKLTKPAITMLDGPLELYRDPQSAAGFEAIEQKFKNALDRLRLADVMTLGYVDKPGSDLCVRMLELIPRTQEGSGVSSKTARAVRVLDSSLFSPILKDPGDRSAIFEMTSASSPRQHSEQRLHFFYLNVGSPGQQHLARVEVPAWVAKDKAKLALIQAVLLDQTRILGSQPYPYLIHRAHEVALVSMNEHQQVEEFIVREFIRAGIPVGELSPKQALKNLSERKQG